MGSPGGSIISRSIAIASTPAPTRWWRRSVRPIPISTSPSTPAGAISPPAASTAGRRVAETVPLAGRRRHGPRRLRSRHRQRAARRRRRTRLALPRGPHRRDLRALGGARRRELRHVHRRRLLQPPGRPVPRRCGGADGARRRTSWRAASRSASTIRSSGSTGRAALLNRLGAAVAANRIVRAGRRAAAGRPVRRPRRARPATGGVAAPRILEALLRPSRPDLAGPHPARRRRSRRHLAAPAGRAPQMPTTGSCPSTSCRNGSPIR